MSPAERKHQALFNTYHALLTLLAAQPENTISVSALCKRAKVSRSYYYKHFVTFDDVIKQAVLVNGVAYLRSLPPITSNQTSVKMTRYFQTIARNREETLILLKVGKHDLLLQSFATVQSYLYEHDYVQFTRDDNANRPYWKEFLSGAVVNVCYRWLTNGCQESPAQMGRLIADFLGSN